MKIFDNAIVKAALRAGASLPFALMPLVAFAQSYSVNNPLGSTSFCGLINSLLQAAMIIGVPVAVLAVVYAGFKFVAARGNPEELKKAQANLFYTVIGIAVFFGAAIITGIVIATLQQFGVLVGACSTTTTT